MEKKDAVKELLSRGEIPTPELIERMTSGRGIENRVDEKNKQETETTKETGTNVGSGGEITVKIISPEKKEKLSREDFTSYYNSKYDGLRKIISSKVDAISINKAREMFGGVGIIGMVREKTPTGYIIEDTTGSIELVLNDDNIGPGDVIGVSGQVKENRLFGKSVVLPDIPLIQKYNSIKGISITFSKKQSDKKSGDNHLYFHTEGNDGTRLSNGSGILISNKESTLRVLFYSPTGKAGPQECIESLKKRHLIISQKEIVSPKDDFVITEVPDILWIDADTRFVESYKGVVIISPGNEEVSVNLETKKIF